MVVELISIPFTCHHGTLDPCVQERGARFRVHPRDFIWVINQPCQVTKGLLFCEKQSPSILESNACFV
jgi:hypothetical protein